MFSTKIATQYIYNSVRLQNSYILGDNPHLARDEIIIFGIYKIKRHKVCYVDIGLIVCWILLYFTLLKYKNHSKVLFILVWRIHKSAGG